jgi:hypothetical protein
MGGDGSTVIEMLALPFRACASVMEMGSNLAPGKLLGPTVAVYEKVLSLAITSPFDPLSKKDCDAEPPIDERSPVT